MSHIIRAAMMLGLLCGVLAAPLARPARAALPDDAVMEELFNASLDSTKAAGAEARIRSILVDLAPDDVPIVRHLLTQALITQGVSTPALIACADTTFVQRGDRSPRCGMYVAMLARTLGDRREAFGYADSLVWTRMRKAQREQDRQGIADWSAALGRLYNRFGRYDSTIALLAAGADDPRRDPDLDWYLGAAYAASGRLDEAIDAYVRNGSVIGADSLPAEPLTALYRKRFGGLDGLDARLAAARAEHRRRVTFEANRVDSLAPSWTLPGLDGRPRHSRDLAGRLVVLKFWGSWCQPCIQGMPGFIRLMHDPRWKDVTFLTVDVELGGGAKQLRRARALVREKGWTIPVVQDSTFGIASRFGVRAFPTVVLIDRRGHVRYFDAANAVLDAMVADQLSVLLAEDRRGRAAR